MNPALLGSLGMFGSSGSSLPNKGPFQCGLFQPDVFQNDCAVAPTGTAVGHVGKPSRPRQRHFVHVDGVDYEVRSQAEAVEILTKLRELAQKRVQRQARKAVAKSVEAPVYTPLRATVKIDDYATVWAQQLQAQVDAANAEIAQQYAEAVAAAQVWQRRQMAEQDDEDALIALGVL